jgi:hypothetical protein
MTENFQNEFLQLIASTKSYIAQEYPAKSSIIADPETFNYFKMQAQQARVAPSQKTVPASPPPSLPRSIDKVAMPQPAKVAKEPEITPKTAPLPEIPKKQEPLIVEKKTLKRETLESAKSRDFSALSKLWQDNYPHSPILNNIPSDEQAKLICQRWQYPPSIPEVVLLYFNENLHEKAFLSNVAAAITQYFAPAGLIAAAKAESEKNWDKLLSTPSVRLVIAHHHSLYTLPELTKNYCEDPVRGNHTLGRVPLLLLSDLSLYMQQPKLKIALWQSLCQRFAAKR